MLVTIKIDAPELCLLEPEDLAWLEFNCQILLALKLFECGELSFIQAAEMSCMSNRGLLLAARRFGVSESKMAVAESTVKYAQEASLARFTRTRPGCRRLPATHSFTSV
jgi:hypothetical protein